LALNPSSDTRDRYGCRRIFYCPKLARFEWRQWEQRLGQRDCNRHRFGDRNCHSNPIGNYANNRSKRFPQPFPERFSASPKRRAFGIARRLGRRKSETALKFGYRGDSQTGFDAASSHAW
jgi:hypothetical protein